MTDVTSTKKAPPEERKNKCNNKKEYEMVTEVNTGTAENTALTADEKEEFLKNVILKTFEGYTGKGEAYRMCADPDTGAPYIINPNLDGIPREIYSYKTISLFRNQFGGRTVVNLPDPTLKQINVWGETVDEFLERLTKEWGVLPCKESEPVPPKFDLPEPEEFKLSYNNILDILFEDNLIDDLDHPVLKKLMKTNAITK